MPKNAPRFWKIFFLLLLIAVTVTPVFAQSQDGFQLGITKTFGFANGDLIRGTFTLYITGSPSIKSVQYLIDGNSMGTVNSAPFNLTFQTTSYPTGFHDLSVIVETTDGRTVTIPSRRFEFATPDQETSGVARVLIPILAIVVLVALLGAIAQIFFFKKKFASIPSGTQRNYGIRGGTICPRCHRPYSIHLWAINFVYYRVDRCDFCGKWAFVRSYSMDSLRAAEQKELASTDTSSAPAVKTDEEKLREMIDKSKYTDQ